LDEESSSIFIFTGKSIRQSIIMSSGPITKVLSSMDFTEGIRSCFHVCLSVCQGQGSSKLTSQYIADSPLLEERPVGRIYEIHGNGIYGNDSDVEEPKSEDEEGDF
jgi:hypothetical protein